MRLSEVGKMKFQEFVRLSMTVAMVANLSGCATYAPARMPNHFPNPAAKAPRPVPVAAGMSAKATLNSGESVSGEVTAVSDSSLTIGRIGNYGLQEIVVPTSELARLEVEDQSGFGSSTVKVAALVIVVLTLGIVTIAATHDPVQEF
jgi:hypothetical protein